MAARNEYCIERNDPNESLVSIIVPVFNTPTNLLKRSFCSIFEQSYKNYEVILVDDGSTDTATVDCVEAFAAGDERVKLMRIENKGVSVARNTALEVARGAWIMFMDADDELLPGALERAVCLASENDLDVLYAAVLDVFADGNRAIREMGFPSDRPLRIIESKENLTMLREYFIAYESQDRTIIPKALSTGPWSRLFSRKAIGETRFMPGLSMLEDTLFNSETIANVSRVGILDEPFYAYYENQGSILHTLTFGGDCGNRCKVFRDYVERVGLSINSYYSHVCSDFFMVVRSYFKAGCLTSRDVRTGFNLPCYNEAFSNIDMSMYQYDFSVKLKYLLVKYRLFGLLVLLYNLRNVL